VGTTTAWRYRYQQIKPHKKQKTFALPTWTLHTPVPAARPIYIYIAVSINFSKLDVMFDTLPAVLTLHRPVSGHVFCTVRTLSHATNPGTTSSRILDRGVHQPAITGTPPHLLHVVAPCSCSSRMQHGASSSTRQTICPQIIIHRCLPPRPLFFFRSSP